MNINLPGIQAKALAKLQQRCALKEQSQANCRTLIHELEQLSRACFPAIPWQAYNQRPELINRLQQLPEQLTISLTELVRLLLLQLISQFSLNRIELAITDDIRKNYQQSVLRIYQQWADEPEVELTMINDLLLKDIGLLSGALLPCTERVVEPFSVIQRSLAYTNGFTQGWRFINALIAAGGVKPVCRLHIHLSEINSLTAAGWRATCRQLAQLLLINPKLKGVVGASWFYDPAVAGVSPKLSFITEQLKTMQADCFFSHAETERSGALSRSTARQQAFAEGHYQPKNYVIFIPRRHLLCWFKGLKPE